MTTGRIQLLGDVAVVDHDGVRSLRPGIPRTLFALLAVDPGRPVDASVLVHEVWGERPPTHPRNALHVAVTRLRVVLRHVATLRSSSSGVTLEIDRDRVDLLVFLDATDAALRSGDRDLRASALERWAEPVLPGTDCPRLAAVRADAEARHRALVSL